MFGLMNLFSRASGGMLSDLAALRFGMRGRIWALWIIQSLSGAFCIGMAYCSLSLNATIGLMVIFSIFCQQVNPWYLNPAAMGPDPKPCLTLNPVVTGGA